MAQIKVNELSGIALDWAVVNCEGRKEPDVVNNFAVAWYTWPNTHYSTNWAQGGPIIEREGMNLSTVDALNGPFWVAHMPYGMSDDFAEGATPLIAAMRCYVASKLGNVVEVPDALIK